MKLFALLLVIVGTTAFAADPPKAPVEKPTIKILADGFPAGHNSPEGVATDLARAFIKRDLALFESSAIKPFGGGEDRKNYEKFIAGVKDGMEAEAERKEPSRDLARLSGAAAYFTKPFPGRELIEVIRQQLPVAVAAPTPLPQT